MLSMMMTWALAAPFDGCTFHRSRLAQASWPGGTGRGCADYRVQANGCIKTKVIPPTVVTYQGDLISGRAPEYFIEVTPHFGESVFARGVEGAPLAAQLEAARQYWEAQLNSGWVPKAAQGGVSSESNDPEMASQFWHARVVKVPYALPTWGWPEHHVTNVGPVGPAPCFLALSEFTPHVWADTPNNPESTLAGILNGALGTSMCNLVPGLAFVSDLTDPPRPDSPIAACALPVTKEQVTTNMFVPGSEVSDVIAAPSTMCAGRLGPLFPRSGWTNYGDELNQAQLAAYRMASIGKDHFLSGPGVEAQDRWQVVWPPAANPLEANCFVPGAERPLVELLPAVSLPLIPATDGPNQQPTRGGKEGSGSYVFAVWRRWTKCVEPGQGAIWEAEMNIVRGLRQAACRANPAALVNP